MANAFCHIELSTTDVGKAKAFYSKLFSWALEDVPMGPMGEMTYTLIKPGDGPGGGLMQHPVPGAPSAWMAYVLVEDVKAATAKAKSLGAEILQDSIEVPNMGWFSIAKDPTGAVIGLWQAKS